MTSIAGYDHLSLSVSDATRSALWYGKVLGFVVLRQAQGDGFERVILFHPDSRIALGLTCHDCDREPEPFVETGLGMDHVAFAVASREGLEAWKGRLEALGVEHSDVKETPTGALITLRDPDNIQLELRTTAAPA